MSTGTRSLASPQRKTYANTADRDEVVDYLTEAMADIGGRTLLIGKNWMINTPDPAATAESLGGTVITVGEE